MRDSLGVSDLYKKRWETADEFDTLLIFDGEQTDRSDDPSAHQLPNQSHKTL